MSSGHELKHFYTCVERLLDMCWRTTRHEPCSAFTLWREMNDTMVTLLPLSCCLKARGFTNPLSFYIVWWSYCDLHPLTPYAATPRWSQHCSAAGHCLLDPYLQLFMMVSLFVIVALFLIHFLVTASTTHIWSHKLFAMVALSHQCLTFILSTEIIFMRAFITPLQAHRRLATHWGTLLHWGIKIMVK